jgi:hypothetical protein
VNALGLFPVQREAYNAPDNQSDREKQFPVLQFEEYLNLKPGSIFARESSQKLLAKTTSGSGT